MFNAGVVLVAILILVAAYPVLLWIVTRRRLRSWAEKGNLRIVSRCSGELWEAPNEISDWARREGRACYVVVEDRQMNVSGVWVDVGGIAAAICDLDPTTVVDDRYIDK
jgi:hypothetical protein